MRGLATVQKISALNPIPNADRIEVATIQGWKCVVKKGEFSEGDLCLYFEIDSFLPVCEDFEFLRANSYKNTPLMGEGFRIKTQKFRGQISQGLVMGLDILLERGITPTEGLDVTETLGVKLYELPPAENDFGSLEGDLRFGIPRTTEMRIQTAPLFANFMFGKPYYITAKADGTSVTMYAKDGVFGITGHSREYVLDDDCKLYQFAKAEKIEEKLLSLGRNIAVQGEFCGPGIEKNRLGLEHLHWYVFDVMDLDTHEYFSYQELKSFCKQYEFEMVQIVEEGTFFRYSVNELISKAEGKYLTGKTREGIVVRSQDSEYSVDLQSRLSFKVINNKYLLKNDL